MRDAGPLLGALAVLTVVAGTGRAEMGTMTRDQATLYTRKQFEELCVLRTGDGKPLTWRHVRRLILIKDAATRSALQSKAAKEGWTTRRQAVAVAELRGEKTSPGGRTVAVPEDLETKRRKLVGLTGQWLRFYDALGVTEAKLARLYFGVTRRRNKERA